MTILDLQNISNNYENIYFGVSDKNVNKLVLDILISILIAQNETITQLQANMENRMICKNYKEE